MASQKDTYEIEYNYLVACYRRSSVALIRADNPTEAIERLRDHLGRDHINIDSVTKTSKFNPILP